MGQVLLGEAPLTAGAQPEKQSTEHTEKRGGAGPAPQSLRAAGEQKHLLNFTRCHFMLLALLGQRDFTAPPNNDKWCSWTEMSYSLP